MQLNIHGFSMYLDKVLLSELNGYIFTFAKYYSYLQFGRVQRHVLDLGTQPLQDLVQLLDLVELDLGGGALRVKVLLDNLKANDRH